jgi:pimeloyl-ACP methyl ester carboxylesterase
MHSTSKVAVTTGTLRTAGASVYYEVRGDGPPLMLVGCPMDATAFASLADLFAVDHTVITTDPRGINRSTVDDPDTDVTPDALAGDLAALLQHLDLGPVAMFGSSGGAVTALALAQAHPDLVRTVVAHEPPLNELLDDREQRHASADAIIALYLSGDKSGAWAKFFADADIVFADGVPPMMGDGEPDPQAIADELFFFAHTLRPTTHWQPNLEILRAESPRIIVGVGEASTGQLCSRTSAALATAIHTTPVVFPGDHVGFLFAPDQFAACLRAALHQG